MRIDNKKWVSAYMCGLTVGVFLCLSAVYVATKSLPPPEKNWGLIEQSRGEGYRRGYVQGYIDKQNGNEFDDTYITP